MHRPELDPPTMENYDDLKDAILELLDKAGDVKVKPIKDNWGLFFSVERLYADCDVWAWPLTMVKFSGILTTLPGGGKMTLRYRELALHPATENNSVNHDYILRSEDGEITEYGHAIHAAPVLEEPTHDYAETPVQQHDADMGKKLLKTNTGRQLELVAGDCNILFERVVDLIPSKPL